MINFIEWYFLNSIESFKIMHHTGSEANKVRN